MQRGKMRSIEKRIREIENRLTRKEPEGAWLAFINPDETVNLSHIKYDDVLLNSREELQEFIELHNMQGFDIIIVDHATCKGEPPKEL